MDTNPDLFELVSNSEKRDLHDFELLEQLVIDDVSFLSSLSTVERVLEDNHKFTSNNYKMEDMQNDNSSNSKDHNENVLDNIFSKIKTNSFDENLKDSFAFYEKQDKESWSKVNSQDENYDNKSDVSDEVEKGIILSNDGGSRTQNNDDSGHDENENDEGDYLNEDNDSSTKPISRIQNQHLFSQLAAKMFPGMKETQNQENQYENTKNDHLNLEASSSKFPNKTLNMTNSKVSDLKATALNSFELVKSIPIGGGMPSKLLNDRLKELEDEIKKFKKDNEVIAQQKNENGNYLKLLKKELAEFEMKKKMEKEEFEKYKNSEIQKLKKDRKIFESYKTNQEMVFNKETRKEIESLKNQLDDLKGTLKEKEKKHQLNADRWKERVVVLENENGRLKDELVLREKDRCDLVKQLNASNKCQHDDFSARSISTKKSIGSFCNGKNSLYKSIVGGDSSKSLEIKENNGDGDKENNLTSCQNHLDKSENCKENNPYMYSKPNSSELEMKYLIPTNLNNSNANDPTTATEIVNRIILPDGSCCISYSNGTTKTTHPDSHTSITYFNHDTKETFTDGRTIYFYANSQTKHHTFPDGTEIYYFQSGQTEKHYPVGTREVTFPDGTIKYIDPHNNCEETIFTDGSWLKVNSCGETEMEFANGQREIHKDAYRRREYPDGTSKTVFNDGTQETKYSSGRVRIKDANGTVIFDGVKDTELFQ